MFRQNLQTFTKSRLWPSTCGRFGEPWLADMESTSKVIGIETESSSFGPFGHLTSGDKGSWAVLRGDHSTFASCLPEEKVSPHFCRLSTGEEGFAPLDLPVSHLFLSRGTHAAHEKGAKPSPPGRHVCHLLPGGVCLSHIGVMMGHSCCT